MNKRYKKEMQELGWYYNKEKSMCNYYIFTRKDYYYEELIIDTGRWRIYYYSDDNDCNFITLNTLEIVMKIFREEELRGE